MPKFEAGRNRASDVELLVRDGEIRAGPIEPVPWVMSSVAMCP
jgi:hypothetical protein